MSSEREPAFGRRRFLGASAAVGLGALVGCRGSRSAPDQAVAPSASLGIDLHNHVYPAGTEPHPQHGGPPAAVHAPDGGPRRDQVEHGPTVTLGLADELARSGLTAVCTSFVLDFAANEKPGDARDNFLRWLGAIDAELAKGGLHRALNGADLQRAVRDHEPVIVQTVEGAHFIEGQLDRIDEVYGRGLRHLQLLHEKDDLVSPLGDTNTGVSHLGGLTAFGAEVVKRCHALGIVVDLAHAGAATVRAAASLATAPLVISHTSLDSFTGSNVRMAEMMRPRLLSKENAKVIADTGGLVGVWTKMAGTLPEFVTSIKAMVDAIGADHVGIGTDTDLLSAREGQGTNRAWPGLALGFFPAVSAEMQRQGFRADEIEKVGGGNYARLFGRVTAKGG